MNFTYSGYGELIHLLKDNDYKIVNYHNWSQYDKVCILRHDIDYNIEKAYQLAQLEYQLGISSTYFVLLTSDLYNVFSKRNVKLLKSIIAYGHEIGLHFDETVYPTQNNVESLVEKIQKEVGLLEESIENSITAVSMHRPSRDILNSDIVIPNIVNSYSQLFFDKFKYLSDSRRQWREPVEDIVKSQQYNKLHILTHAFWYNKEECDLHDTIISYLKNATDDRYGQFKDNFSDIESIVDKEELK